MSYSVYDYDGVLEASGLSLSEAAEMILTHDGAEFDIRPSTGVYGGYELWGRKQTANKPWTRTIAFSLETDLDEASLDIFSYVIYAGWTSQTVEPDMLSLSEQYKGQTKFGEANGSPLWDNYSRINDQEKRITYYFDLPSDLTEEQLGKAILDWHGDIPIYMEKLEIDNSRWCAFIE